ncbi:O-antigen ligase family protein [Microvirga thermotolerans]|uniref:O-antigen ligase domain-containing protein n=1 Tax=Microvirga thermotolerans TaxID=2651334 RepID=A0A5P9JYD1_9HYPH|nr:O-antigen ligase family protein [Microvirga thermotolerans]QFU17872.1 O-antigen ligase domain-containing protein [Microvirga thermotolerans]
MSRRTQFRRKEMHPTEMRVQDVASPGQASRARPNRWETAEVEGAASTPVVARGPKPGKSRLPWPAALLLISLVIPWIIQVGPVRLSVYRIVLLLTLAPSLALWCTGRAGRIRVADIALLFYALWCVLGLVAIHGVNVALQPSAVILIETMGPYLLARLYIRDAESFYGMVNLLFKLFVLFLPLTLVESLTGRNLTLQIFGTVFPTPPDSPYEPRWGLRRVQGFLEHPILYGVFTGSIVAMVYMVLGYGKTALTRYGKTGLAFLAAFLCMSAGPISAVVAQIGLITWNGVLKASVQRWKLFWGIVAAMYMFVAVVSNQSVPEFYIGHFSFDEASAYYRVLIWRFGSESALNHPFFGVGLNEWERPDWMPNSIDMFWLIHAVLNGIPAALAMLLAFFSIVIALCFKQGLDPKLDQYRMAHLFSMAGFFLVGWTVHFWNGTYVLFMFLLGSGVWLLDVETKPLSARRAIEGSARQRLSHRRTPAALSGEEASKTTRHRSAGASLGRKGRGS